MTYGGSPVNREETSSLRAAVSGGLNTADSDLQTPLEMSPDMNNTQVDFDGMVRKRRGYKVLFTRNNTNLSNLRGSFVVPFQTSEGRPMLLMREFSSLIVMAYDSTNGWTLAADFANVLSGESNDILDYVTLSETLYNRIIMVRDSGVPIQFSYISTRVTYVKGGAGTSWAGIELPPGFVGTTTLIFVVNGVVVGNAGASTALTGNNTIMTVTTLASFPAATYELEVIHISWQWWAEALQLKGNQFMQTAVQANGATNVATPSVLLQGIEARAAGLYPLHAFSSTNYDAVFTRVNPPTTATEYTYSNGSIFAAGIRLPPSPFGLAFGAGAPANRNIHIVRGYLLPFYGGSGPNLSANSLDVIPYYGGFVGVRNSITPPSEGGAGTGAANFGFQLRLRSNYIVTSTVGNQRVPCYITLDGTTTATGGLSVVQFEETYHVIDVWSNELKAASALGSTASNISISQFAKNYSPEYPPVPRTSYAFPVAGISWFADYKRKSFPTCIGTIQGRVVLGGFPDQPMRIVFSNVYDSDIPGYFCNNFDVVYSIPSTTSPFDLTLPGAANDKIISFLEFNDSLFVFTQNSVYRVHNNNELISVTTAKYSLVASIGAVNSRSTDVVEDYPVFLSTSGVYAIVPDDTAAGYGLKELSSSIRNYVQQHTQTIAETGLVLYDTGRSELYVGLSDNESTDRCGDMLVFNTRLNTWYRYTSRGGSGFHAFWGCVLQDTREGIARPLPQVLFTMPNSVNDADNIQIVEMNQSNTPVDLHQFWDFASVPFTTSLPALQVSITTVSGVVEYTPNDPSFLENGFILSPIRDLQDCDVILNGVTLTFGTQWYKTDHSSIILVNSPSPGLELKMQAKMLYGGSLYNPVAIVSASGQVYAPNEYTTDISAGFYRVTGFTSTPSVGTDLYVGYSFPAWYSTPTFNRNTLNVKRLKQYIGYYHNTVSDTWTVNDAYPNAASVGKRRAPLNCNLAVVFSNEYDGFVQTEIYSNTYPQSFPTQQTKDYARMVVPIVGGGYNIKMIHHNNSPSTFKLAGYELVATPKKGKGYAKSEGTLN